MDTDVLIWETYTLFFPFRYFCLNGDFFTFFQARCTYYLIFLPYIFFISASICLTSMGKPPLSN